MSSGRAATGPALEEEDRARADLYALLARLYYAGPDAGLVAMIAVVGAEISPQAGSPVAAALQDLAAAASVAAPVAVQQEYTDLFVGTGRAEVSLYATHYLAETGREKILVGLRAEVAAMGLSRKETSGEPEDHFTGLFDVMRHLTERGSSDVALQDQRRFFGRFIERSYGALCGAIAANGRAEFYGRVAVLTRKFLDVEKESLQLI